MLELLFPSILHIVVFSIGLGLAYWKLNSELKNAQHSAEQKREAEK